MKLTASPLAYCSDGILIRLGQGPGVAEISIKGSCRNLSLEQTKKIRDQLIAAINAGQAERQVTHTKKGSTYDVVASAALFQVSNADDRLYMVQARPVQDGDEVVIYRNPEGMHFVRFPDEMVSPRFEETS